jgi:hypothetical protein
MCRRLRSLVLVLRVTHDIQLEAVALHEAMLGTDTDDARAAELREDPREDPSCDWRSVDRALRSIAQRQAALDAEEARWLRQAEAL